MELRHLRYFVAVAEELHFGRAATRIGIAQPPLSQQIRRLEAELGVRLFARTKRRVAITDAGRALLDEARATLDQAERAAAAARWAGRGENGRVFVGAMASADVSIFPRLLPVLRRRHPGIEVVFKTPLSPSEQFAMLRDGRLHAGFVRLPASDGALEIRSVVREPLVAVLPARHALARRRSLPLGALRDEPFVLFPRAYAPGFYDVILDACADAGVRPAVVQETERLHNILTLVGSGRGVSVLPRSVGGLARRGVVCRPLVPASQHVETGVAYNPRNESAPLRRLLAVIETTFSAPRRGIPRSGGQ